MEFGFKETGIVGEPQYQKEFLWQELHSKGNVKIEFKGTRNVGEPQ